MNDPVSPFHPLLEVATDPAMVWLMPGAMLVGALLAAGVRRARRKRSLGWHLSMTGLAEALLILIFMLGLGFANGVGPGAALEAFAQDKHAVTALSFLFVAGLIGARLSLGWLHRRHRKSPTEVFE